jgi:cyclic beta-1,2-glucan synthetase
MKRPAIQVHRDAALNAVFFENPGNAFRKGPAFAAMSLASDHVETNRGRFLGKGRGVAHPYLVEKGQPDTTPHWDDRPIAGFLGTLEIPAGEERTVVVVLGQTDNRKMAAEMIRKYKNLDAARPSLDDTRRWWRSLMSTVSVQTNRPDFDQYQNWLKYQAVAERIWARRGFYQTSGAFGFRDQLQDSVNLIWVDPALARKQILAARLPTVH